MEVKVGVQVTNRLLYYVCVCVTYVQCTCSACILVLSVTCVCLGLNGVSRCVRVCANTTHGRGVDSASAAAVLPGHA